VIPPTGHSLCVLPHQYLLVSDDSKGQRKSIVTIAELFLSCSYIEAYLPTRFGSSSKRLITSLTDLARKDESELHN
jgi:hypothetical protein